MVQDTERTNLRCYCTQQLLVGTFQQNHSEVVLYPASHHLYLSRISKIKWWEYPSTRSNNWPCCWPCNQPRSIPVVGESLWYTNNHMLISERYKPCNARCCFPSVARSTVSVLPSILTEIPPASFCFSSPFGPLTWTVSSEIRSLLSQGWWSVIFQYVTSFVFFID